MFDDVWICLIFNHSLDAMFTSKMDQHAKSTEETGDWNGGLTFLLIYLETNKHSIPSSKLT